MRQVIKNNSLPYIHLMRLNKPIGSLLLLWPTLMALLIATQGKPSKSLLLIFITGVFVMRSAGCIINDILDRDVDGHVQRTKQRPLATGSLSLKQALSCLIALLFIALALVLALNTLCFFLSLIGLSLSLIYPLMKRCCPTPQVVLGLTFNWGVIMAFAATQHAIPIIGWQLYLCTLLWTIAYDTQYAMVDKQDDLLLGLHSTAIFFGRYDIRIIGLLQLVVSLTLFVIGIQQHYPWPYYLCISLCTLAFVHQQYLIRKRLPTACFKAFLNNNYIGLLFVLGTVLSYHPL